MLSEIAIITTKKTIIKTGIEKIGRATIKRTRTATVAKTRKTQPTRTK